jgi:hypothetical protein
MHYEFKKTKIRTELESFSAQIRQHCGKLLAQEASRWLKSKIEAGIFGAMARH